MSLNYYVELHACVPTCGKLRKAVASSTSSLPCLRTIELASGTSLGNIESGSTLGFRLMLSALMARIVSQTSPEAVFQIYKDLLPSSLEESEYQEPPNTFRFPPIQCVNPLSSHSWPYFLQALLLQYSTVVQHVKLLLLMLPQLL
jgi:hypothetical protein